MAKQDDLPGEGSLSRDELQRYVQEQMLDTLREIDALIEGYQNSGLPEEPRGQVIGSKQKLYLRWKKGEVGEEE